MPRATVCWSQTSAITFFTSDRLAPDAGPHS